MLDRFFNSQTKTIGVAAGILAVSGLVSRLLGLVRDRLLAGKFGASPELDIYFAAFRIPDFVFGILITGGIVAVFLPLFSEYFKKNPAQAWEFTNNVLNCFLILLIFICGILALFTPLLIKLIAPGFAPEQKTLAISLTRIMFLSPIFFGLSSVLSGVLHYFNRFLVYSIAPILYNLGIIFGILFFLPIFGLLGLAYGVVLGAFFHGIIQIPAAKSSGYSWQPFFNFRSPGVIKVFKLMIPRTIGAAAYHLNLIVITAIASTLAAGSITIFNFANNLQYLPIGLIGVSFALASFPVLSRALAEEQREKFLENFSLVFRQILFLIIPISVLMFILKTQIVRIILETGQFGALETRLTAASLGLFVFGIFAFSFFPFLSRAFFSFQDTKTPAIIGIVSTALNIILAFLLVGLLGGWGMGWSPNSFQVFITQAFSLQGIENIQVLGLPLAWSLTGIFQFVLLMIFLYRKIGDYKLREIFNSFLKILIASIFMAVFVYLTLYLVSLFLNLQTFSGIFWQTLIASLVGVLIYIIITPLLRSPEIEIIKSSIFKVLLRYNGKH